MRYLYSAYVWFFVIIYFVIISSLAIILMYLISAKKTYNIYTFLLKGLFKIMFIKVKIEYAEDLDLDKNYLYMPNHISLLDAPLMFAYTPHMVNALEAKEHFSWPLYGKLIKMWGNIPVDRKNAKSSYTSMMKGKTVLQERNSIIIYPEGGRTVDGKLKRFKKLPFHIAKEAEAAIVPVGVSGLFSINKKGTLLVKPGTIKIKYGNVVSAEKVKNSTDDELLEHVRNEIEGLIEYI